MAQATAPFDPIIDPLNRVVARRRLRALARLVLACMVSVLAALVVLALMRRAGYGIDPLPVLLGVGVLTTAIAGTLAWRGRRTTVEEAFFIDRSSGFGEAYGTAVELAARPGSASAPVPAQLMDAVRARAGTIAPARLVKIVTPGFVLALFAAVGLAAAAWWIAGQPVPPPEEIAVETAAPAEPADAETVSTIAQMLAEDAQDREDPLLDAIARTLDERAQAARMEGLTPELQQQINDLLDQAAAAYGEDTPRWLGDSEGMRLAELEDALAALEAAALGAAPTTLPPDPNRTTSNEILAPEQGPGLYDARPELAERYADRQDDEVMGAGGTLTSDQLPTDLGDSASPSEGPALMEPQRLQSIGSIPVGAALDSGRGLSNAAGLGEQDIQADDAFTQLGAAPGEDMVVSAEPQAGGSRIRIEIVPQTAEDGVNGAANAIGGQTGSGSTEPVARDFIPSNARDIAARYFERLDQ